MPTRAGAAQLPLLAGPKAILKLGCVLRIVSHGGVTASACLSSSETLDRPKTAGRQDSGMHRDILVIRTLRRLKRADAGLQ